VVCVHGMPYVRLVLYACLALNSVSCVGCLSTLCTIKLCETCPSGNRRLMSVNALKGTHVPCGQEHRYHYPPLYICIYIYIYIYTYVYIIYMYIYMYICIYIHIYSNGRKALGLKLETSICLIDFQHNWCYCSTHQNKIGIPTYIDYNVKYK